MRYFIIAQDFIFVHYSVYNCIVSKNSSELIAFHGLEAVHVCFSTVCCLQYEPNTFVTSCTVTIISKNEPRKFWRKRKFGMIEILDP